MTFFQTPTNSGMEGVLCYFAKGYHNDLANFMKDL